MEMGHHVLKSLGQGWKKGLYRVFSRVLHQAWDTPVVYELLLHIKKDLPVHIQTFLSFLSYSSCSEDPGRLVLGDEGHKNLCKCSQKTLYCYCDEELTYTIHQAMIKKQWKH
jgi:hypothetical protein